MTKKALAPIAPVSAPVAAVPGFDAYAKTIAAAAKAAIAAGDKLGAVVAASINAYLDACRQAGVPKNELGCAQLALAIRGSEPLKAAVAAGWLKKTTVSEYGTGAMRAYYHGIPWTASLKNSTDAAHTLPWSKKGAARPDDGTDKAPTTPSTSTDKAPTTPSTAPVTEADIRDFVRGYAKTLESYLNKHIKLADLQTREVVQQFARAVAKLPSDKAPF